MTSLYVCVCARMCVPMHTRMRVVCVTVCVVCVPAVCAGVHECASGGVPSPAHLFAAVTETEALQSPAESRGILYFRGLPW